ncbi:uncharacterized protein FOMMEDRAFT_165771 [Fomitiporia mediterranea MF3/22]|uniref:uncharacterized protein n=1 Tax=Fomitiporia mediterranea (strain MF3/22) TaxID=694068 RepID=UPI0004407943|nr:uncharacterized protein FOMMEDRAFT_165771 [Fomitiporia mediterranea MF3/22]EJD05305.1 hypothetical protein FOMMEDRAFT_165771 [Fomitiporia mediterranea MF3/22]
MTLTDLLMTMADSGGKPRNKSRSEKKAQTTQPSRVDRLKAVVRRLPPNLPEDVFWQSVQPWVTDESVSWRTFYSGKVRKKYNKENTPSRAYIAFKTAEQLATFSQAYDGHIFRDKSGMTPNLSYHYSYRQVKGNESVAIVEFAPSQKVPSEKRKLDPRMGTIDQGNSRPLNTSLIYTQNDIWSIDEDFISFFTALNTPASKTTETDAIEALVAASQPPPQPKSTPLLDALRAEKQAQRDRETILKAHAHYRDRDREDVGGRKRGKQPQQAQAGERDETVHGPSPGKRNRRGGKRGEAQATAALKVKDKEAVSVGPAKSGPKTLAKPSAQQATVISTKDVARDTAPDRRPRPVIGVGLASRQFEAALTGAGVFPGGGSERKSRRERERERKANETALPRDDTHKAAEKPEKPTTAIPGKDRSRGGRKRGDNSKNLTGPIAASGAENATEDPVPVILSRTSTQPSKLQRQTTVTTEGAASMSNLASGSSPGIPGEGRGGGRRGGCGRGVSQSEAPASSTPASSV